MGRAHLTDSHIFSFVFHDYFFKQVLLFGSAFFGKLGGGLLLLWVKVIQIDLVAVFVLKGV